MNKDMTFDFLTDFKTVIKGNSNLFKELNKLNNKEFILQCEVYEEVNEIEVTIHSDNFDFDNSLVVNSYVISDSEEEIPSIFEGLNYLKDYLEYNYNCTIEIRDELVYLSI